MSRNKGSLIDFYENNEVEFGDIHNKENKKTLKNRNPNVQTIDEIFNEIFGTKKDPVSSYFLQFRSNDRKKVKKYLRKKENNITKNKDNHYNTEIFYKKKKAKLIEINKEEFSSSSLSLNEMLINPLNNKEMITSTNFSRGFYHFINKEYQLLALFKVIYKVNKDDRFSRELLKAFILQVIYVFYVMVRDIEIKDKRTAVCALAIFEAQDISDVYPKIFNWHEIEKKICLRYRRKLNKIKKGKKYIQYRMGKLQATGETIVESLINAEIFKSEETNLLNEILINGKISEGLLSYKYQFLKILNNYRLNKLLKKAIINGYRTKS